MDTKERAARIRDLRKSLGISVREVSALTGFVDSSIHHWEKGRRSADEAILDIASFFGSKVITNDQYRDHADRHPWLETNREEMLSGVELRQDSRRREVLLWKDIAIRIPPFRNIRSFADQHTQLLAHKESQQ